MEPGIEDFLKHLKRYGPEGVLDAARDAGLTISELVQIQDAIDKLPRQPRHRKTAEARVRTWLGLDKEEDA